MTVSTLEHFRHPVLEYDAHIHLWRLMEDYVFIWDDPKTKRREKLHAFAGEVYDKASVPRPLWGIARPDAEWEGASFWHDKIYQHKGEMPEYMYQVKVGKEWQPGPKWKRSRADWFLGWLGKLGGASKFQAWQYKMAVKLYPPNFFKGF